MHQTNTVLVTHTRRSSIEAYTARYPASCLPCLLGCRRLCSFVDFAFGTGREPFLHKKATTNAREPHTRRALPAAPW